MDLKSIANDIPGIVSEWGEKNAPRTSFAFVSVLSNQNGEIIERSFGMRRYAKKGVKITEVRRRATGKSDIVVKNLIFASMGGYIPVFEKADRYSNGGWGFKVFSREEFDKWVLAQMPLRFSCLCLNGEMLKEIEEFKYCGYSGGDVIKYLNEYRKNHEIEFFGKLGLPCSPLLIQKATKNKKFRAMLAKERDAILTYGPQAAVYAYKHGITIPDAHRKLIHTRQLLRKIPAMRKRKLDYDRIADYCNRNSIGYSNYNDYLEAVIALKLDLKDTKNLYPKNFGAMHDLRIVEYESQQAKADRVKRKELYTAFAKAGESATAYEYTSGPYSIVAPRDITDLVIEGKILGHCVGKMGYDKKMADGAAVIMFVRKATEPAKPFVTVEYDLRGHGLRQAYGRKNTRPSDEVMVFINEWVCMMKEIMKKEKSL